MKTTTGLAVIAACCVATAHAADTWVNLFDGKSFKGWNQKGGAAKYRVEDGCVVGTTVPNTPNSFMCTDREYADFILEYEFKVDPRMNSGVQIRSHCFDVPYQFQWKEKTIKVAAGRVHGYQVEIDPDVKRGRMWSAGIYDEGRRGWLYPDDGEKGARGMAFSERGRKAFKPEGWNHVRVEAIGSSIKTFLNGKPAADLQDDLTDGGFIALQVHGVGKREDVMEVRWRNIRIQDLSRRHADVLFDGKDLSAWQSASGGAVGEGWKMVDGTIHRADKGGDIFSKKEYGDFILDIEWKISEGGNSGIKYRVASYGKQMLGPEYQVLDDDKHPDGQKREGRRKTGGLYDFFQPNEMKVLNPPGHWNHTRIVARGTQFQHWLNGYKVLQYDTTSEDWKRELALSKFAKTEGFNTNARGRIMLQDHGDEVWYRDITVQELK